MAGERDLKRRHVAFLFNPALLSREELRDLFVARHAERDQILAHVRAAGSSPQHSLLIGDRGMGKTTLLLRVAHSLTEDPSLHKDWLPVRLDEEQYNIGELADFWLNCLQKIGEDTGDPAPLRTFEGLVEQYKGEELGEVSFLRLREYSLQKGRRLLLLVDNFDLLLSHIDEKETRRLREILQRETWLLLVGASARPILDTFDYKSPFYDFFHVIPLEPLSLAEILDFFDKLGRCFHREKEVKTLLEERQEDLAALHIFMGGNLRTATILFSLLQENPAEMLDLLLGRLLDQYTSSYKDLIDGLPTQGRRVFDGLARLWDPATAENVAKELRIERGVASAQLHRLVERDLAVKVQLPQRSIGFKVRDRLFNLWYLMRGGRGQRPQLGALLGFLKIFHQRPSGSERTPETFIGTLRQMHLITDDTLREAHDELRRLSEQGTAQDVLSVATKAHLLALYLHGETKQVEAEAAKLLSFNHGDIFARVVVSHLLIQRGEMRAALDALSIQDGTILPVALQFERARLLIELGKAKEAELLLTPLLQSEEIPPAEIAATAVLIARSGNEQVGWLAEALFRKAAARDPADPEILLAGSEVELALEHPKQALTQFREALAARSERSVPQNASLLTMALRLAKDLPLEVLDELKAVGLDKEWRPLAHALAFLGGESERLEKLSPEMRAFTERVIAAIQETPAPVSVAGN